MNISLMASMLLSGDQAIPVVIKISEYTEMRIATIYYHTVPSWKHQIIK